jgi:putative membrane protein
MMMWGYNMTGMGWWMIISSLIWFGLIAVAVWAFARWANRPSQPNASTTPPVPSATEILRQRYARGEIDSDSLERMRRELETSSVEPRTPATLS